jgi:hypothetical protein
VKHGVNRHHERIAAEVREELGLLEHEPLDPFEYAKFLTAPCGDTAPPAIISA